MATDTEKFRVQNAATGSVRASLSPTSTPHFLQARNTELSTIDACDFFLFHHSADSFWSTKLADCVRGVRLGDRNLRLSVANLNAVPGTSALLGAVRNMPKGRLLAIVASKTLLREDEYSSKKIMDVLREIAASGRQIVTILKDNVTVPPALRLGEWFDFRNENYFEETISDLSAFLVQNITSSGRSYSFGVSSAKERILSNLFAVVELPKFVYSVETHFKTESELTEACTEAGPLPYLLKKSRIYTIESPSQDSPLGLAVSDWNTRKQENFTQWFSDRERAEWGIELLNKLFRRHAWKRGLRWEMSTNQFYFPRNKPKSIWWEIGGQKVSREVTAPHMGWIDLENQARAEVQYGWKHQSVRADFVNVQGNVFFRLEPSWLLTKLDSKTPATTQPVAPAFSGPNSQNRNGQILRSWRFWSTVLAKGHHEIRINTGQAPIRTKVTPISGFTQFGISSDRMNYDRMMQAAMEDDLLMPALAPLEQEIV
jgi:hypothetical protein